MTTDNFCSNLQNILIQTSQTGGQWYSDTSTFSIPWLHYDKNRNELVGFKEQKIYFAFIKSPNLKQFLPQCKQCFEYIYMSDFTMPF